MKETETQSCKRAALIIQKIGGVDVATVVTGRSKTRVYSWTYPKDRHGTGGMIPPECQISLLEHSRENDLGLSPSDFFPKEHQVESVPEQTSQTLPSEAAE